MLLIGFFIETGIVLFVAVLFLNCLCHSSDGFPDLSGIHPTILNDVIFWLLLLVCVLTFLSMLCLYFDFAFAIFVLFLTAFLRFFSLGFFAVMDLFYCVFWSNFSMSFYV